MATRELASRMNSPRKEPTTAPSSDTGRNRKRRSENEQPSFLHEANARRSPQLRALKRQFPNKGYGWWWELVEYLREQPAYELEANGYLDITLADELENCTPAEAKAFVEFCCQIGLLASDGEKLYAPPLDAKMSKYDERCEQNRQAALKRHEDDRARKAQEEAARAGGVPQLSVVHPPPARAVHTQPTPDADAVHVCTPPIQSNPIQSKETQPEGEGEGEAELDAAASAMLEDPDKPSHPAWLNDNRFVNAGRRPMRRFPLLWFTPGELAWVLSEWLKDGIPEDDFEGGFREAESKIRTIMGSGRAVEWKDTSAWLGSGFIRENLVKAATNRARLAKAQGGARGR